jgi:ribonuclease T2
MNNVFARLALILLVVVFGYCGALAEVKTAGTFTATQVCPALQSIRKKTNPGDVRVAVGQAYRIKARNKADATHYQIEMPDAAPRLRWVAIGCGSAQLDDGSKPAGGEAAQAPSGGGFYILAVSWQPAFCEGLPNKPECKSQTAERYDAKNFTLHGLWPQPRSNVFCNVSDAEKSASEERRWFELPVVELSADLKARLDQVMPGTQSALERHEWIKHGTCYGGQSMETYYQNSVRLVEALNATAGAQFMAANLGKKVRADDLRKKFDETLGAGAGDRMRFACKRDGDRELLTEITIGLSGVPSKGQELQQLVMAARPTDPGCPEFVVDAVGLQ